MKTLKRIFFAIVVIIVVLVLVSFLLPKIYHIERNIEIASGRGAIYELTANLGKWDLWSPWRTMDTGAFYVLIGPDGKTGTIRKWDGKIIGNGQMTLTQLVPGELVAYNLSFEHGKYNSTGKMIIETSGDSSKVSWITEGDLGYNPVSRYMGLFMGRMLIPDFEKGLAKLKKVAEERKDWPKIVEKQIPAQTVMLIRDSAGPKQYGEVMGNAYGEITKFAQTHKLRVTGPPFAIYLRYDTVTMFSLMDMGIPVEKTGIIETGRSRVRLEEFPARNAVMAFYFGPYNQTGSTYHALHQYCKEGGKVITGGPWEIYITDPMKENDPMKVETDILFPVK